MDAERTIPVGSFGYCAVCYHPFDRCSHCDIAALERRCAQLEAALLERRCAQLEAALKEIAISGFGHRGAAIASAALAGSEAGVPDVKAAQAGK